MALLKHVKAVVIIKRLFCEELFLLTNYEDSFKSIQYKILETKRKLLEENRPIIGVIIKIIGITGAQ